MGHSNPDATLMVNRVSQFRNCTFIENSAQEGRYEATGKREFEHPWHEVGLLNHLGEKVDPDRLLSMKGAVVPRRARI